MLQYPNPVTSALRDLTHLKYILPVLAYNLTLSPLTILALVGQSLCTLLYSTALRRYLITFCRIFLNL